MKPRGSREKRKVTKGLEQGHSTGDSWVLRAELEVEGRREHRWPRSCETLHSHWNVGHVFLKALKVNGYAGQQVRKIPRGLKPTVLEEQCRSRCGFRGGSRKTGWGPSANGWGKIGMTQRRGNKLLWQREGYWSNVLVEARGHGVCSPNVRVGL